MYFYTLIRSNLNISRKDQGTKEIFKIPFNRMNNMKYLGINMTKDMQDLYTTNYKILLRNIKDINKWREIVYL